MPAFYHCPLTNRLHTNEARVFQRNITRIIDGKKLQIPAHRPDMFFDLTLIVELNRDVRDCDNVFGRIIPEFKLAMSSLKQRIPAQYKIDKVKHSSLFRRSFFGGALLVPSKTDQLKQALQTLRDSCETYLKNSQPNQQRRAEP